MKIDRAFVSGISKDMQSAAIVQSTIELGHRLGMIVVAEGVENAHELRALKKFGCDFAQGYHICHPIQAADVIPFLYPKRAAIA